MAKAEKMAGKAKVPAMNKIEKVVETLGTPKSAVTHRRVHMQVTLCGQKDFDCIVRDSAGLYYTHSRWMGTGLLDPNKVHTRVAVLPGQITSDLLTGDIVPVTP